MLGMTTMLDANRLARLRGRLHMRTDRIGAVKVLVDDLRLLLSSHELLTRENERLRDAMQRAANDCKTYALTDVDSDSERRVWLIHAASWLQHARETKPE
jgi:hypothetical protein